MGKGAKKGLTLTPEELLHRLPRRDFWFVGDISKVYGVSIRAVQALSKRYEIGTKVRQGPRGTYVFTKKDLPLLSDHVNGGPTSTPYKERDFQEKLDLTKKQMDKLSDSLFGVS